MPIRKNHILDGELHKTLKTYITDLSGPDELNIEENTKLKEEPDIFKAEILYAIKTEKAKETPGPDEIPAELRKMIEEDNIQILVHLFNNIYSTDEIPDEWLKSILVPLPKKQRPKICGEYRMIALIGHTLKIFLRIIHNRIRRKCEEDLDETQFILEFL